MYLRELDEKSITFDTLFSNHSKYKILDYFFVFDKSKNFIDSKLEITKDEALYKLINHISTPSLEKFQFKLVRKINHFRRADEANAHIACQQFFYEGRDCQDEAYQLVRDELMHLRQNKEINPHYIIYDCFSSEWLATAVETVVNYISSESQSELFSNLIKKEPSKMDNFFNLNKKDDLRNNAEWKDENNLEIIFITDLIHTGNTFRAKINKLKSKFPKGNIYCISALITDLAFKQFQLETKTRKIKINNHEIKYFKRVEQIYKTKSANRTDCNMCKHKLLPLVPTSTEITENLSSFEMWLMCEEAGYKFEDYQPRARENRIIPNSLELFKKNGTLLAIKFEQHLKINGIFPFDEIVIIFPNETKTFVEEDKLAESIEKTPSGYFAKCLSFYNEKYNYLGIPRKMIQLLEKGVDLETIKTEFPKTFRRIEDIDKPIIIIDEVNFTGKTFKTITDILHEKGKNPVCYFPVFNFDAEGTNSKYHNEQYKFIKFLNLFELNFPSNE